MLDQHTYLVSELGRDIATALGNQFDDVWISGTIQGLNRSRNNVYFDLIEPDADPSKPARAQLNISLFGTNKNLVNKLLKRANIGRIHDGMQVRIRGVVDFYAPRGRLSVRMTSIDPTFTLAKMVDERDRVLQALEAEGLLGRNSALPMPAIPLRVGLVTAADSAAYHDFVNELSQADYAWQIVMVDSLVQGAGAPSGVASAIGTLDARHVDVIAVVRGGGSKGDLVAFDHELIARAIAGCQTPVVTGIGHEINTSVADAVAHTAYKTPTACAAALAERARVFDAMLLNQWFQIRQRAQHLLADADARLERRAGHVALLARSTLDNNENRLLRGIERILRSADASTRTASQQLDTRQQRLLREAPRQLASAEQQIANIASHVSAYDPARALARGWSITTNASGQVVRGIDTIGLGETLVTRLADGTLTSTVESKSASPTTPSPVLSVPVDPEVKPDS